MTAEDAAEDGPTPREGEPGGLTHWEGEPVGVWEALWEIPRFEAWGRLPSTNDRVRDLVREGAPAFTLVTAEEQTAGRGRSGRPWESAPGLGLWMSVLLRLPPGNARVLAPLLVAVATCRAVERAAPGVEGRIKWPNDVLVGERKLCGILCEAVAGVRDGVVAGVGLNVLHGLSDFPAAVRSSAVSLAMATGREVSRSALAGQLVREIRRLLSRPTFRLQGQVAREIDRRDALRGRTVQVLEGGPVGVGAGIEPGGALRLEALSGETVRVVGGSVRVVDG